MEENLFGVPQGSILAALLFNVFICELFLFTNDRDIVIYDDDKTPYAASSKTKLAIGKLEMYSDSLFTWFPNSGMKANVAKCHFLVNTKVSRNNNVGNNNKYKIKIKKTDN